jgi:hypothetical protein
LVGSLAREAFEGTESKGKAGPTRKGDITSGKIKGKVIYRPTGEPVAYAQIESLNIKTGKGYPVAFGLKTKSDGTSR